MKSIFLSLLTSVIITYGTAQQSTVLKLSLSNAISLALKENPELHASAESISSAKGNFWKGIAPAPPSLSVDYDYIPSTAPLSQFGERKISFTQSLEFPMSIVLRGAALSAEIDVAKQEHNKTERELIAHVKNAYAALSGKQWKLNLAKETVELAADFARKAAFRKEAGEATYLEQITAASQHAQALNQAEIARNEVRIAEHNLRLLLGLGEYSLSDSLMLTDSLAYHPIQVTAEQLLLLAQAENPVLRREEARLSSASHNRSLAWSSFLPSLNASYAR
jgi:cobalt-zinc-cadmium efflux system outer membrane protein